MKIRSLEEIAKKSDLTPAIKGGGTAQGEGDFLTRINNTIENFRGLVKDAGINNLTPNQVVDQGDNVKTTEQNKESELANLIGILIKFGYGDTPIGQLLQKVSPFTLKQIVEVMQNAVKPRQ